MSSLTDFLFEGRPPKSVTTYGQTVENVPKWMSDYTQGLIARANAAAAEPYIPYGGPRVAGFSPTQEAAFGLAEENVGAYQPYTEAGARATMGGLEAFSEGADPLSAASPYLEQAGQNFPGAVDQYMNPYIENVLNRNESLAGRALEEKFLPGLQRTFAGAGQYGSRGGFGSMEDIGVRGVRDITEGLNEQNLAALSGAYETAGQQFQADQARQAQLGDIAGGLEQAGGTLDVQRGLAGFEGAGQLGRFGEQASRLGFADAAALEQIGRQERGLGQAGLDLAYQDFKEQRDLPFERVGFMSDIVRGLPASRATSRTETGPQAGLEYGPSGLDQILGAYDAYRGATAGKARGGYQKRQPYREGGLARVVIDLPSSEYEVMNNG